MSKQALILAGGLGTRLRPVIDKVPKPMAPVAGRPFLDWVIDFYRSQGVERFCLSAGYMAEVIAEHYKGDSSVEVIAEPRALGTGGGATYSWNASTLLIKNQSCLVGNGDSLVAAKLEEQFKTFESQNCDVVFSSIQVPDAGRFGTLSIGEGGALKGFASACSGPAWINAGVYIFAPNMWKLIAADQVLSFEADIFPQWIAKKCKLNVVKSAGEFLDMGTVESYQKAEDFVLKLKEKFL